MARDQRCPDVDRAEARQRWCRAAMAQGGREGQRAHLWNGFGSDPVDRHLPGASSDDAYSFGSAFVGIGIAVLIIGGALAGLVFNRKTRQAIGAFESGDSAKALPVYKSIGSWAILDTALMVFAVLAMVAKWGA